MFYIRDVKTDEELKYAGWFNTKKEALAYLNGLGNGKYKFASDWRGADYRIVGTGNYILGGSYVINTEKEKERKNAERVYKFEKELIDDFNNRYLVKYLEAIKKPADWENIDIVYKNGRIVLENLHCSIIDYYYYIEKNSIEITDVTLKTTLAFVDYNYTHVINKARYGDEYHKAETESDFDLAINDLKNYVEKIYNAIIEFKNNSREKFFVKSIEELNSGNWWLGVGISETDMYLKEYTAPSYKDLQKMFQGTFLELPSKKDLVKDGTYFYIQDSRREAAG